MLSYHYRVLATLLLTVPLAADPYKPANQPAKKPTTKPIARQLQIDYGPFVTATIPTQWPEGGIVNKAIAIKLLGSKGEQGGILFDTDTCRVAAGWTGGFVQFTKDWTGVRDSKSVKIIGTQIIGTRSGPGWANPAGAEGAWTDPRPNGFGPLPKIWSKYKGLYLQGDQVVLSYSVGSCDVLESPGIGDDGGLTFITRTYRVASRRSRSNCSRANSPARTCERASWGAGGFGIGTGNGAVARTGGQNRVARIFRPQGSDMQVSRLPSTTLPMECDSRMQARGRAILVIPPESTPCRFKLLQTTYHPKKR